MKRFLIPVLTGVLLLTGCGKEKGIEVHSAWMRPAAQGENGAVYFVIHNHSSTMDEIVGASSDIAAVEIHTSMETGGALMQMHEMASVTLEGFAEIEFAPGGLHLMLISLKQDAGAGNEIVVVLHFRNSEDIKVIVPVGESAMPEGVH